MMFTDTELDRWRSNEPTWHGRQVGFYNVREVQVSVNHIATV